MDSIKEWTTKNPAKMKNHKPLEEREKNGGEMDHLLFWPVGQKGLARFLAQKINEADEPITKQLVKSKLKHLSKINWDMFAGPWYGFVLRQRPKTFKR